MPNSGSPIWLRVARTCVAVALLAVLLVAGLSVWFGERDINNLVDERRDDLTSSLVVAAASSYNTGQSRLVRRRPASRARTCRAQRHRRGRIGQCGPGRGVHFWRPEPCRRYGATSYCRQRAAGRHALHPVQRTWPRAAPPITCVARCCTPRSARPAWRLCSRSRAQSCCHEGSAPGSKAHRGGPWDVARQPRRPRGPA